MSLAEQWDAVENGLDPRWRDARVTFTLDDESRVARALALLGPVGPGRSGRDIRFIVARSGGIGPEAIRRMLDRIDGEGISGTLVLVSSDEAPAEAETSRASLAAAWDAALAVLPSDWSDLLCELELTSSDHIEPAALRLAPLNPLQTGGGRTAFRFRVAHTYGYGASPGMVGRCLARLDDAGIPGEARVLRALSDTHPVGTQGPVWYVGGRAV